MLRLFAVLPLTTAALLAGCSSAANSRATPTAAISTAPPAQTAVIRTPTPGNAPSAGGVLTPSPDVLRIVNQIKFQKGDLPPGISTGQLEGYQNNQAAASGFDDYDNVVKRMDATGRLGGLIQGLTVSTGGSAGDSIDVWRDAQGAKQYFDQYPSPTPDLKATTVALPHPVGDQSVALRIETRGQTGYSISWRRGRIVLGVGLFYPAGQESLDDAMKLVDALDAKAQAVAQ